jgi:tRNA-binding protein
VYPDAVLVASQAHTRATPGAWRPRHEIGVDRAARGRRCGSATGGEDSRMEITWDDFAKVDIRVGRIVQVDDFPKARKPAYKLRIDFGAELGVKTSSAQITKYYDKAALEGKLVLAVVNFPPRQIATFFSEVLTLGVVLGEGDIVLVHPDRAVPPGSRIG